MTPGRKPLNDWRAQLTGVAGKVDCWRFASHWMQGDGKPVVDLNDLLRIDYDCWEGDRAIIDAVMSF